MKLVDLLARELTEWAGDVGAITQDKLTGELFDYYHCPLRGGNEREVSSIADDAGEAHDGASGAAVTRAEWQAAVDALNAPKVVEWDGVGLPPAGTICEVLWNESRVEYLRTKVFGVNEHGQPIHRFDEGPKKYKYQADVLRTASGTQVFRPIRTAEQVAAEEREKAITLMIDESLFGHYAFTKAQAEIACKALYEAGYRKEPKPCGS